MDFSLSMEQKILRDSVRAFAEKEIKPVAQTLDETETFSYELTRAMGELGLFGIFVSEQYGGQELDYLSYIIAVEELARVDGSQAATVAAANSLGKIGAQEGIPALVDALGDRAEQAIEVVRGIGFRLNLAPEQIRLVRGEAPDGIELACNR